MEMIGNAKEFRFAFRSEYIIIKAPIDDEYSAGTKERVERQASHARFVSLTFIVVIRG